MKRVALLLAVLVVLGAAILRDGPLGPPMFSSEKYGEVHITAMVWFAPDDAALAYAATVCGNRNMSIAERQVSRSFGMRWVKIICSP